MNKPVVILLAAGITFSTAFGSVRDANSFQLRFVSAAAAYSALEQQLGAETASAVGSVDGRHNALHLQPAHPQAAMVREFLTSFDRRPAQVKIDAVVTRRVEATATTPARNEVLSRPTIFSQTDRPVTLSVPGNQGPTTIELRITTTPAQKQ